MKRKRTDVKRRGRPKKRRKVTNNIKKKQKQNKNDSKTSRLVKVSLSDAILGISGIKIDDRSNRFFNKIPETRTSSTKPMLKMYRSDFIYRLLFFPRKLMYLAGTDKESAHDPLLDEKTNKIQNYLLHNCKKLIEKSMEFPESCDRRVSIIEIKTLSDSIQEHIRRSQNVYYFRFLILRLIHTTPQVRELVKEMMPPLKFSVLIYQLNSTLKTDKNIGIEMQLHPELKFNKIVDYILELAPRYMFNYGIVFLEGSDEPIFIQSRS